jgi:acetate kinase
MTDARSDLNVLALNSGSSSLKFGLYRVGFSRTQMLLSGEAEAIGEKKSKFRAPNAGTPAGRVLDLCPDDTKAILLERRLNAITTPS